MPGDGGLEFDCMFRKFFARRPRTLRSFLSFIVEYKESDRSRGSLIDGISMFICPELAGQIGRYPQRVNCQGNLLKGCIFQH